jgi:membrane associated rhomboid family serine protease
MAMGRRFSVGAVGLFKGKYEMKNLKMVKTKSVDIIKEKPELILYCAVIGFMNISLLQGRCAETFIFDPYNSSSHWWQAVTCVFVHVSWYHLLLDAGMFVWLYTQLREKTFWGRCLYLLGSWAGSMIIVWATMPSLVSRGFCGLSGIGHGLMMIWLIELATDNVKQRKNDVIVWIAMVAVLGKSIFEALTGKMLFGQLHSSLLGSPVGVSHIGGIIGGVSFYMIWNWVLRDGYLKSTELIRSRLSVRLGLSKQPKLTGKFMKINYGINFAETEK